MIAVKLYMTCLSDLSSIVNRISYLFAPRDHYHEKTEGV